MPNSPSEPPESYDAAVVGAGPAGLAAAVTIASAGRSVALVDDGARPGGQFWRHAAGGLDTRLHHDARTYRRLEAGLDRQVATGRLTHLARTSVWTAERASGRFVLHLQGSGPPRVTAGKVVFATGAYDRQIPFPGWDLPGVYTAGAAQALLEEHGILVGRRVAVGGTGPFLLSVAAGLARRGATVVGVYEANSVAGWLRGPAIRALAAAPAKLLEGASYTAVLARARVPVRTRSAIVSARGTGDLAEITTARLRADGSMIGGTERRVGVDALAVGWGFTPRIELPILLGCRTAIGHDGSPIIETDVRQESSVPGVFVAGETTGVGGAALAVCEGELAGLAIASARPTARLSSRSRRLRAFAAAMHRAHPVPPGWVERVEGSTIICRCEEVDGAALRQAVTLGADDARTAKLLARTGMGWCQGRVCGYATACLTAAWSRPSRPDPDRAPGAESQLGISGRPITTPISLETLARSSDD